MSSKATRICLAHIGFALSVGLLVYLFLRQNTYLHTIFANVFPVHFTAPQRVITQLQPITNHLGDFLWSYALCFTLYLTLSPFRRKLPLAVLGTISLGILLELLQKLQIIHGTFDYCDIAAEAAAAALAAIFIKRSLSS